jgi:hypothetical protein
MKVHLVTITNDKAFGDQVKAWSKGEAALPADLGSFSAASRHSSPPPPSARPDQRPQLGRKLRTGHLADATPFTRESLGRLV